MFVRIRSLLIACAVLGCAGKALSQPMFVPAPGSPITVGGAPGSIVVGDVNGDGVLDLAVGNGNFP